MNQRRIPRRTTLKEAEHDLAASTAEERLGMMWQLTLDAWAFMGESDAESQGRHITRVVRRKR